MRLGRSLYRDVLMMCVSAGKSVGEIAWRRCEGIGFRGHVVGWLERRSLDRGERWMFWRDCVCQMRCWSRCGSMKSWQCGFQQRKMKAKTDRYSSDNASQERVSEIAHSFPFTPLTGLYYWTNVGNSEWVYMGNFKYSISLTSFLKESAVLTDSINRSLGQGLAATYWQF